MRITYCEICGAEVREEDRRYVNVTKSVDGEDKPCCPEKEICACCSVEVIRVINGMVGHEA